MLWLAVALAASFSSRPVLAQVAPGESACAALRQLQVPGAALSELTTEWFAAGSPPPPEPPWVAPLTVRMPAYCRVGATLDRRTGADGKSYGIGFALALPAEWNGRFLFQGGGGLNGSVAPPLGRTGQGDAALTRGFAVVTTRRRCVRPSPASETHGSQPCSTASRRSTRRESPTCAARSRMRIERR